MGIEGRIKVPRIGLHEVGKFMSCSEDDGMAKFHDDDYDDDV